MKITDFKAFFAVFLGLFLSVNGLSQNHQDAGQETQTGDSTGCAIGHHEATEYDPGAVAFHHIADQNIYTLGPWHFPLPCILYSKDQGLSVFSSSRFQIHGHHGNGENTYDGYVLTEGKVRRVNPVLYPDFPSGEVSISGFREEKRMVDGKERTVVFACVENQLYELESASTADFGLFGGGFTSFYSFSITKNVVIMIFVALLLGWVFLSIAWRYKKREGMAPRGLQSFIEPIYIFIRDDVAKSVIGPKYERFMPFLMSIFFFILVLNLIGQVPFIGNPNVTGNLAVTLVLALLTFLITNLNGRGNYWQHIFWMPGIPFAVKLLMTPIEIIGLFLKPITLMVRLFANITAGHIVILSFVGLIFIFGKMGDSVVGGYGGAVVSVLLTLFMSAIELLVAFIQAFIFTILSASYFGMAVAEEHH
ncbi:MAG TPA: F0F1 ATP synthase subunit A [Saprospiraceae bacterium]|nr:F0F1 ATP synthase subunit A [Saprospiraceae bacterium]